MRGFRPPSRPPEGGGDPWAAFGYLVAGVGAYGALGWGLGTWLHASYLLPIGILLGAVLGLVLVFYQFGRTPGGSQSADDGQESFTHSITEPGRDDTGEKTDRGETE